MSLNNVVLIGNQTRDAELRYTPNGTAVADFSLAVNRKWKNEAGESMEEVSFIDCSAFGRTAEIVHEFAGRKGNALALTGRLKQENWNDKTTGQKRSKLKVIVESVTLLNNPRHGDSETTRPGAARPSPAPAAEADEIPF